MKKIQIKLCLALALPFLPLAAKAAVPSYDAAAAKANAKADFANWMKYLPDDVFVAHVSIPGTHDTATAEGWKTSTGSSMSTTQEKTIDEQLAGGIRAFDFRPGMVSGELWCNHGADQTSLKLADAFRKLKNYLNAHPSEFFVMHVFRGNIYRTGEGDSFLLGLGKIKNDATSQAQYDKLFDDMFNKGEFVDMFIDYSPYLKVKDVRGKIIVFRRDRIDFAHIHKAGNLNNWPGEADAWTADHKVSVVLDSDPSVKGVMRVTDVSSPDNDTQLQTELNSIKGLFEWQCNQTLPNDAKRNGSYKPDWSMIFTSGALNGENTDGYKKNAAQTNPYFTGLIKNATKKGPTGIVLSDWVLTNNYNAQGVELIPTIIENNFDYISDYILDDQLFADSGVEYENIWDDSKWYFMRNVGTGDFLSAGEWWGTHSTTGAHGIKVRPKIDKKSGKYTLMTTLNTGGGFGYNWYVDNTDNNAEFDVKPVGDGKYIFSGILEKEYSPDDKRPLYQTITVGDLWGEFAYDGTTHNVVGTESLDESDPYQQWELISVDDYLEQQLKSARRDKGSDVSFLITGGRFFGNDTEISSWNFSSSKAIKDNPGMGANDSRRLLRLYNLKKSGWSSWDASWTLTKDISNLPKGLYTLRWKGYHSITDHTMTVTIDGISNDVTSQLQRGSYGIDNSTSLSMDMEKIGGEMKEDKYTCKIENFKVTKGTINIKVTSKTHSSATMLLLDDFELIYYGPIYPILDRAIEDAKRRLGSTPDWLATYETNMNNLKYDQADEGAAPALEIYQKMRELTLAQTPDDTKHQDYTNAFINAGFETGTLMGWETSYTGEDHDTGVKPNEGVYVTQGGQNQFLFNCWQQDPNPDNRGRGVILSQTIPGLPAGHYMVTAQAANDDGDCLYIEVNGQRSEALVVEGAENVSKLISFEFEVAENTEAVTISFMGGNSDGSFDDYGGNWYKVDDIHLYRAGSADFCVFYRRLLAAMQRVEVIAAKTLPQYYQDKWDNEEYHNKIAELIQNHLDSDHNEGDLNGSNGLAERTELFNHFSAVVLSQAETKANMSGAIRNNSFELGDLSYWTTKASPIAMANVTDSKEDVYNISGRDEKYIYFADLHDYEDYNGEAYPIYQTITGLPKGQYRLSVSVASTNGNTFYLAANGVSKKITATGSDAFQKEEVEFEITADGSDLTLGLYPSADGNFTSQEANAEVKGPWFAVDNFELWLIGRQVSIDWTMETPTHGTIILPFAVSADELTEKGLKVYSVTAHVESTAEGATHHILQYTEQPYIAAHTPYVVQTAEAAAAKIQAQAVKASGKRKAEAASGKVYTFEGFTQNEKMTYTDTYTNGNLTGTLVEAGVTDYQYHLQNYEDNVGFVRHEESEVEHETVAPYHAYITLPKESQGDVNIHGLYFEEPTLPLDWYMEGEYYGTIILPFEAEIPADLDAYTVTGIGEKTEMPRKDMAGVFYHLLTIVPVEDGKFAANVPYLVINKSVNATEEVEGPINLPALRAGVRTLADEDAEPTATFKGQATNTTESNKVGLLTGVHVDKAVSEDDKLHLIGEADKKGAFVTNVGVGATQIDAHHAYIAAADLPADHGELLLLAEPQADDENTGIDEILAGDVNVDVYNIQGILLKADVKAAEALRELAPGVYILHGGDKTIKVIK
ncbi:MAG: hypothetical protein K2I64_07315 [Muribaculaceae bacterium]|nr:hypothetical protein [Muribaculaceae bacterium]